MLVDAIRGGLYVPGERLPGGHDLAARLEVSRGTVREAIGVLERAGIVAVRRGNTGGVFVRTRSIPSYVLTRIEGETGASIRSLLETRRALELAATVLVGERATCEQLAELDQDVVLLSTLLDEPDEFIAVDLQFHVRVGTLSGNELISKALGETLRAYALMRSQYPVGRMDLGEGLRHQRRTLRAIRTRDRAAILRAVDDHLGSLEEHFLGERLGYLSEGVAAADLPGNSRGAVG
jgi:GntR family transcriptional repressor for pyruvate dehydrogenase complex